jgi:hypothetical protein
VVRFILFLSCAIILLAAPCVVAAPPLPVQPTPQTKRERDVAALLDGVETIAAPGVPGPLCLFGSPAFPLVTGRIDGTVEAPVVAAARCGRGRLVAFGHPGYFHSGALETEDTGRLVSNAARWAAPRAGKDGPRIGVRGRSDLVGFLSRRGIRAEQLDKPDWLEALKVRGEASVDVLCIVPNELSDEEIVAIWRFVRRGGGLLAAELGWGWLQLHPGKSLREDHPGNRLLTPAGLVWADGTLRRTAKKGYAIRRPVSALTHGEHAFYALLATEGNRKEGTAKPTAREVDQAAWTLTHAARSIPGDDWQLLPKLRSLRKEYAGAAVPTSAKPLTLASPLARIALTLDVDAMKKAPVSRCDPHPAAAAFPGSVSTDAPRVTRSVTVDLSVPGWQGTGLYAPPGGRITVATDPADAPRGLRVRIGCHKDALWHHKTWRRCPEICRSVKMEAPVTRVANPFGGLVYVEVPGGLGPGEAVFTLSGGVEAPRFVLGLTAEKEWREGIRSLPAPWAELETEKIVLTVPASAVRGLDKPEELMRFWDRVSDACRELAALPPERERPERYVADVQISAGYMHAGYPIMTHLDIVDSMLDTERLRTNGHGGVWGLFHELGHNHQSSDWTFGGTGEVTVNLFTLCVFETVCGLETEAHPSFTKTAREDKIRKYRAGGADFDAWKRDPFLALIMYIQLREAFGWEAYRKVFALYRDLPGSERPKSDDAKRDQWLVRFSRVVERDLGPFFEAWGVPVSADARAAVVGFPEWMPPGFPPE